MSALERWNETATTSAPGACRGHRRSSRDAAARRRWREDRLRRHQQDQGSRGCAAELEGHGRVELADRRVRSAADRLPEHPEGRRMGRREDEGVGPAERRAGAVAEPDNGFPRGWTNDKFYLAAVSPQAFPIPGTPSAWTPGTERPRPRRRDARDRNDGGGPAEVRRQAEGQVGDRRRPRPTCAAFWNRAGDALRRGKSSTGWKPDAAGPEFGVDAAGGGRGGRGGRGGAAGAGRGGRRRRPPFNRNDVLPRRRRARHASRPRRAATASTRSAAAAHGRSGATLLPAITIPAEQYGRIARMLDKGVPVTIEADIKNTYHPNPMMFNVVGEIPRHRQGGRGRDARRALRLVARVDGRDRQRGRHRRR